jgi:membrane-bound ClpP family serine protease
MRKSGPMMEKCYLSPAMRFSAVFRGIRNLLALVSLAGLSASADTLNSIREKTAIVIPIEDQVDYGLHAYLKRATSEALKQKPDYLVFEVNTYGGELHSAFEIVDLLLDIRDCSTYVFVEKKAISAGALISLACNRMAMGEGTTIGDCAPITQSQEGGIVMLGEKIQSPLRAKFRNLAERNGYPSLLSQAMVTADLGVVAAFSGDTANPAPELGDRGLGQSGRRSCMLPSATSSRSV